jgi:hypothetical protein
MNELFGLQAESKPLVGQYAKVPRIFTHVWLKIEDQSPCGQFIKIRKRNRGRAQWISVKDTKEIIQRTWESKLK